MKKVWVMTDELRYNEPETVQEMPIDEYWSRHAENRASKYPVIIRRVSPSYARRVLMAERGRAYSTEIQKKYNVGPDWQQNRWFVEQVRPHL